MEVRKKKPVIFPKKSPVIFPKKSQVIFLKKSQDNFPKKYLKIFSKKSRGFFFLQKTPAKKGSPPKVQKKKESVYFSEKISKYFSKKISEEERLSEIIYKGFWMSKQSISTSHDSFKFLQ